MIFGKDTFIKRHFSKRRNYRTEPYLNFLDAKEKPFLNPVYVINIDIN